MGRKSREKKERKNTIGCNVSINTNENQNTHQSSIILNGDIIHLKYVNENNVRKYFHTMNYLSLFANTIPDYDSSISPVDNLNKFLNSTNGSILEWELIGDWNDCIEGNFDRYLNQTFEEHFFDIFNKMINSGVNISATVWNSKSYSVVKHNNNFKIFENNSNNLFDYDTNNFLKSYTLKAKSAA